MIHVRILPLLLVPMVSGCASGVAYPSLAERPVERAVERPSIAVAPLSLDPAVGARAAALAARARQGEVAMVAAERAACPALRRGLSAAEGGEAWIEAQRALSAVEVARAETVAARDDMDALVLEQARGAGARAVDLGAVLAAADEVTALDTAQAARLAALRMRGCAG